MWTILSAPNSFQSQHGLAVCEGCLRKPAEWVRLAPTRPAVFLCDDCLTDHLFFVATTDVEPSYNSARN